MEKFSSHTGIGVPLRRNNVDTDQIIPAVYLKRVTRLRYTAGMIWSVSTLLRRSGRPVQTWRVNFSIVRPPGLQAMRGGR